MFFCEFYEISKNIFFIEHLWATASIHLNTNIKWYILSRAIWKSWHRQLGIGIGMGISICIAIAKILFSAYEKFFEKLEHLRPVRLNIRRCAWK